MRGSQSPGNLSRTSPQGLALNSHFQRLKPNVRSREISERRQVGDAENLIYEEALIHEQGQEPMFEPRDRSRGHEDDI